MTAPTTVSLPHTARPSTVTGRVAFRAGAARAEAAKSRRRGRMGAAEATGVCLLLPRRTATVATSGRRRIHQNDGDRPMRKRVLVAAVAGLALAAAPAAAQESIGTRTTSFSIGGGATLPIGDAGDAFDTGFNLQGSLHLQPPLRAVGARFDVMYHSMGVKEDLLIGEADLNVLAGAANVVLTVSNTGTMRPYVLGGLGLYNLDFGGGSSSETKAGLNGGGGVEFGVGGFTTFIEARLHSIFTEESNTNLVPVVFGVRF